MKAFNYVDSDGEHVITRDTFCEEATKKVLERWLGPREDWAEEFDSIDMTNKKGDGNVLFRVSWISMDSQITIILLFNCLYFLLLESCFIV